MNILIAEPMAAAGIELFKSQPGWNIIISNPKEYAKYLPEADALVVRSAVQVTPAVLEQAPKLRVIGRAGVGVDNVDLPAATAAGVMVMNTPGGNAVSVAEHTLALMLSMARRIPQASASTKSGKWEKKKFLGSELRGKTLGIAGLGSIGREVVKRARAFSMRIIAHDPYLMSQLATDLGVELVSLDELFAQSDYLTLHVSLTPETNGFLNEAAYAKMKKGIHIVNCARGELICETALKAAMENGTVAGTALDVFPNEPTGRRLSVVRARKPDRDSAHRRFNGRSAGDCRRPDRRTDGGAESQSTLSICRPFHRSSTKSLRLISTSRRNSATLSPTLPKAIPRASH